MSKLGELIVQIAKADLGQEEKPANSGFKNALFEARLKLMGWLKGQSWCSYEAESIWKKAFAQLLPNYMKLLDRYFSGSTVQTWKNFRNSPEFKTSPNIPVLGALAIWQDGTSGKGHIGVVSWFDMLIFKFRSIEGNTNKAGSREGNVVGENSHPTNQPYNPDAPTKRWLMGFVYPDPIK